MTVIAQDILDNVATQLYDANNRHWSASELQQWLNAAQRFVVNEKHDAGATGATVQMVAGTRQTIPADGIGLLKIRNNMGADQATPGRAPTRVEFDYMNVAHRAWQTATANATVQNWMFDPEDPTAFWVYPPQPAASPGSLRLVYAKLPADITNFAGGINLDDRYANVLTDYVLFRAWSKGNKAGNAARAQSHYALAVAALGRHDVAEMKAQPKPKERADVV